VKIDELLESFIGIRDPELGMFLIPRFILKQKPFLFKTRLSCLFCCCCFWILVSCESF